MFGDFKNEIKAFCIILVVAVIIVVGGILLLKVLQSVPIVQAPSLSSVPASSPQPQALDTSGFTLSEFEDWQTYRNDEFGFEFQYPPFLKQLEKINSSYDELSYCDGEVIQDIFERCVGTKYSIGITVYDEPYSPEQVKKYYDAPPLLFDGTSGIREYQVNGKAFSIGKHSVYAYVGWSTHTVLGDKTLGISFSGNAYVLYPNSNELTSEELRKIKQILSTFRFTEPIDISDWQTYRSEEFGFEMRYPEDFQRDGDRRFWKPGFARLDIGVIFQEKSVEEYVDERIDPERNTFEGKPDLGVYERKEIEVGGYPATYLKLFYGAAGTWGLETYIATEGNSIITIQAMDLIGGVELDGKVREIYDQILATFRFIE